MAKAKAKGLPETKAKTKAPEDPIDRRKRDQETRHKAWKEAHGRP